MFSKKIKKNNGSCIICRQPAKNQVQKGIQNSTTETERISVDEDNATSWKKYCCITMCKILLGSEKDGEVPNFLNYFLENEYCDCCKQLMQELHSTWRQQQELKEKMKRLSGVFHENLKSNYERVEKKAALPLVSWRYTMAATVPPSLHILDRWSYDEILEVICMGASEKSKSNRVVDYDFDFGMRTEKETSPITYDQERANALISAMLDEKKSRVRPKPCSITLSISCSPSSEALQEEELKDHHEVFPPQEPEVADVSAEMTDGLLRDEEDQKDTTMEKMETQSISENIGIIQTSFLNIDLSYLQNRSEEVDAELNSDDSLPNVPTEKKMHMVKMWLAAQPTGSLYDSSSSEDDNEENNDNNRKKNCVREMNEGRIEGARKGQSSTRVLKNQSQPRKRKMVNCPKCRETFNTQQELLDHDRIRHYWRR